MKLPRFLKDVRTQAGLTMLGILTWGAAAIGSIFMAPSLFGVITFGPFALAAAGGVAAAIGWGVHSVVEGIKGSNAEQRDEQLKNPQYYYQKTAVKDKDAEPDIIPREQRYYLQNRTQGYEQGYQGNQGTGYNNNRDAENELMPMAAYPEPEQARKHKSATPEEQYKSYTMKQMMGMY